MELRVARLAGGRWPPSVPLGPVEVGAISVGGESNGGTIVVDRGRHLEGLERCAL